MKNVMMIVALVLGITATAQEVKPEFKTVENNMIEATYYHDNGEVAQKGLFKDNMRHGEWISYDADGNKTTQAEYNANRKVGKWFFWKGDVLTEVDYTKNEIVSVNTWVNKDPVASNRP